jgi:hypothetical protein
MKLKMEWARPISLKNGSHENLIYTCDHRKVPQRAGIYVFGRRYGRNIEALYVGQAGSLQGRVKSQFKNLPLMMHLQNAKNGKRILLVGRFIPKPGQKEGKCLDLVERALIRHFLSEAHDLVNIQGAKLRRHEITSLGAKGAVPEVMFVDRAKSE